MSLRLIDCIRCLARFSPNFFAWDRFGSILHHHYEDMLNMREMILILGIFCVTACGQKGALYLPEIGTDEKRMDSRTMEDRPS